MLIFLATFPAHRPHRRVNARFVCALGFLGGVFYAIESSAQRFMGIYENSSEVRKYGALSLENLAEANKRLEFPARELISPPPHRFNNKKSE